MITVAELKDSMRIKSTSIDDQLYRDIASCLLDLKMRGINTYDAEGNPRNDALIDKAIELYCKADLDYQGQGDKFMKSYENLTAAMQSCGDYRI